jgi:hypothetical protein
MRNGFAPASSEERAILQRVDVLRGRQLCSFTVRRDSELSLVLARSMFAYPRCFVEFVSLVLDADRDSDYNKLLKIGSELAFDKVVTNQQFAVFVS